MEKYSVLMSLYTKENPEYLRLSIESILNQTILPDEFIIVKDGTIKHELEDVLNEYSSCFPELFRITGYEKNQGLGYALNYGLNQSRNDLIARMDSDDYSLPERCEMQIREFEKCPNLSLLGTEIYRFTDVMEPRMSSVISYPQGMEQIKQTIRRNSAFAHPTVMFRKKDVLKCGGYDPEMRRSQDHDLFSRMISMGFQADNLSKPLLFFRSDENGKLRNRNSESCRARIVIQKRLLKRKQCTLLDYLYIWLGVTAARIVPKKMFLKLYFLIKEKSN